MPGKILIIDGIATNRISLRVRLSTAFYEVVQASTGAEGMTLLDTANPDLVLIASTLPDLSACALCRDIRALPSQADIPVVILDSAPTRDRRLAALAAGADDALDRNADPRILLAHLRSLLRHGTSREDKHLQTSARASAGFAEAAPGFVRQPHVAVVSDDTGRALTWVKRLQQLRPYQVSLYTPQTLSARLDQMGTPDVFLIGGLGPKAEEFGTSLLAALGAQPGFRRCKFLMAFAGLAPESAARILDLGAHALMTCAFDPEEASLRLDQLLQRKARSDLLHATVQDGLRAALVDPLTGLHNRRYALPELSRLLTCADASGHPLAVMLADLDHFKQLNDGHGHSAGDAVLAEVSHRLRATLRPEDLLARFGGEEFLIALPGLTAPEAHRTADRLRRAVGDTPVKVPGLAQPLAVTISIGLTLHRTTPNPASEAPARLLQMADQALYRAKAHGRNQVTTLDRPAA